MAKPKSNITVVTDDAVDSCILDILRNAKKEVGLVSPYLNLWGDLEDQITAAINRGIEIGVLIREPDDGYFKPEIEEQIEWLLEIGVDVLTLECLHAMIYMNEKDLVVSSMNLTPASTKNPRDIALVIHDEGDQRPIREYVETLASSAVFLHNEDDEDEEEEG
jgi:phosphatidylserine/phosphatidylglycerophosphate/cardiolipin synthase-like enzyme